MAMRITENMNFDSLAGNVSQVKSRINGLLEQLATGKKINRPADDPEGIRKSIGLRFLGASIDQYQTNIINGENWLNVTSVNLAGVSELVNEAKGIAQSMDGAGAAERDVAARHVQSIIDGMLSLANARHGDRYIFAGTKTNTPPFAGANGPYQGDSGALTVNIGQNTSAAHNIAGDAVFSPAGGCDIFLTLGNLRTALENNDSAALGVAATDLEQAGRQVITGISRTGVMLNRLEFARNHLTDLGNKVADMMAGLEAVDVAKLAVQLQMQELALNASYGAVAKISEQSILNFLK